MKDFEVGSPQLDPRQPKVSATIVQSPQGPILCTLTAMADITPQALEVLVENIALRVIQKLDERKHADEALQPLPE